MSKTMLNRPNPEYYIPFQKCEIAGDILTLLLIGDFMRVNEVKSSTEYWWCYRSVYCSEIGNDCWLADGNGWPFDPDEMRPYIMENGTLMEHGSRDYLDILIEYLENDSFDRQQLLNSLFEVTGYRFESKEEWLNWFKKLRTEH